MTKTVGVVLAGAGYLDGSEITEAVLSLYFLERAGLTTRCLAPDRDQFHVVDHRTGEPTSELRNVLTESARIARGEVEALRQGVAASLDALVLPGGFGMAKNLSDFAFQGARCTVDPELSGLIRALVRVRKPVVALCIAPAILAAALREEATAGTVTIGDDPDVASAVEALGFHHQKCPVDEMVVDSEHRLITAPAYMYDAKRGGIGAGIEAAISQLARWLG